MNDSRGRWHFHFKCYDSPRNLRRQTSHTLCTLLKLSLCENGWVEPMRSTASFALFRQRVENEPISTVQTLRVNECSHEGDRKRDLRACYKTSY